MTFIELAKRYFPDASYDEANALLWECTAFPFSGAEALERQISETRDKANTVGQALYFAYGEMDRCWREHQAIDARSGGGGR